MKFFYEKNNEWLDYVHQTTKEHLAFLAVKNDNYEVLELLMEWKPDLFKIECYGFTPLHYCLRNQILDLEAEENSYKTEFLNIDEIKKSKLKKLKHPIKDDQPIRAMIDLMLRNCDPSTAKKIYGRFGTILHMLIRLNYPEGSTILVERFKDQPTLQEIFESKTSDDLSPLYLSLQKTEGYQTGKNINFLNIIFEITSTFLQLYCYLTMELMQMKF